MHQSFIDALHQAHQGCRSCPKTKDITRFFDGLLAVLFPNFSNKSLESRVKIEAELEDLSNEFTQLIGYQDKGEVAEVFFQDLPDIYQALQLDVDALYSGDPAAKSREEVIRSYPGFYAIAAYRIAHYLHIQGIVDIPRSITEHAHSKTGIDIHPGAKIGAHFFIDHGTGVVIGETTVIGDHVKIYQGVTLGALSISKELSNIKRHPTIGDHVIIYSGATILGGETEIGAHAVIGGNVWLTRSIPAKAKVYYKAKIDANNEVESEKISVRKAI